jgi:hypothetical protein
MVHRKKGNAEDVASDADQDVEDISKAHWHGCSPSSCFTGLDEADALNCRMEQNSTFGGRRAERQRTKSKVQGISSA